MSDGLAEALYRAAALSAVVPPEKVLAELAASGAGFSEDFRRAYNEVCMGADVESALLGIAASTADVGLRRAANILALGCSTGASIGGLLQEAAEDCLKSAELARERAAGLAVERWTLLLAGGLAVPLILGTAVWLVSGLDLGTLAEFGLGLPAAEKAAILANAVTGNQIYVAAYAVLASVFAAYSEARPGRALAYAAVLAPAALLLFNVAMRSGMTAFF